MDDNFAIGDVILVEGTGTNDGRFTIIDISEDGTILYVDTAHPFVDETSSEVGIIAEVSCSLNGNPSLTLEYDSTNELNKITRSNGLWVDDGFSVGDGITIDGSTADNNGEYLHPVYIG